MTTPTHEKFLPEEHTARLPRPFILRRLHSILGLWLVIYLCEHLLVNSRAAFFYADDGKSFISLVNKIHNTPYLKAVEIIFLGLPFLVHGIWGIKYALTSKPNAHRTNKASPELPQYKRNRAYSWQRVTSWLLVIAIIAHVIHMRFLHYPVIVEHGKESHYLIRTANGPGLKLVAEKLDVRLYDLQEINERKQQVDSQRKELEKIKEEGSLDENYYRKLNRYQNERAWVEGAEKKPLAKGELLADAPSAGAAIFLTVRETFTNPLLVILYSIFVIAAAYHAFNGFWTFMITWGVMLTRRAQRVFHKFTTLLMWIVSLLGLLAAWGTYWTTLFQ